jgi:hypothetical protein
MFSSSQSFLKLAALASFTMLATGPVPAQDEPGQEQVLQQSAPVRARYTDLPITLRSPYFEQSGTRAFAPGQPAAGFTSYEEMTRFIASLGNATNLGVGSLGKSQQGRDVPYLLFTAEGARDLEAAASARPADRPVIWLIGLHHGNEPAGGEAMLALARDLATGGPLADLVQRVTVVIVPRSNPDGAEAFTRDAANKMDLNRDHLLLTTPETVGLHKAAAVLPPDLVIDAHEFTVGGRWLAKFQALHATDFIYMRATHPLVPRSATRLADEVFLPAIEAAAASAGLTSYVYQTSPNQRPEDKTVATGGNAGGIARNAFGLTGAVSILLETRGIGLGAQSFQRRVATHYLAAVAALQATAQDPARLVRTVAEARREAALSRDELIVAHRIPITPGWVPLVDPATGAPKPTQVPFLDARRVEPTIVRPRPVGYVLLGTQETAAAREALKHRAVKTCDLPASAEVVGAEAFTVTARPAVDRRAINPEGGVTTRPSRESGGTQVPAGSIFIPVEQPLAGVVVASLDPDAAGGFVTTGLIPGDVETRLSLLRLPAGTTAPIACSSG